MNARGLKTLLSAPFRYYRSCGFGVHSPFAFRVIGEVIRGHSHKYGYYAYPEIRSMCRQAHVAVSVGFRFYRLLVFANPAEIIVSGEEGIWKRLAALYCPSADASGTVWVAVRGEGLDSAALAGRIAGEAPCYLVVTGLQEKLVRRSLDAILDSLDHGMLFSNGRMALLCVVRGLPFQKFPVWLTD